MRNDNPESQPLPRRKWVKPELRKMLAGSAENGTSGRNPDGQFTTS